MKKTLFMGAGLVSILAIVFRYFLSTGVNLYGFILQKYTTKIPVVLIVGNGGAGDA